VAGLDDVVLKFLTKIFDKFLYNSNFKSIQRLRLIEKKLNILYELNSDFNSNEFATVSRFLTPSPTNNARNVIRIGSKNDGGYVLINKSFESSLLISMGIGDNLDFEEDWLECGGKVVAYDGTITKINSSVLTESTNFFKWIKHNVNFIGDEESISINQAIDNALEVFNIKGNDCVLKMDIEKSEWSALEEISEENLSRFDQIIVEFHDIIKLTLIDYSKVNRVLLKLHQNFDLVWKHENNFAPYFMHRNTRFFDVVETTWHNKNSLKTSSFVTKPKVIEALNSPNDPSYPAY
jgi:hypothetical protein